MPDFSLPGVDGKTWAPADFKDAKVLIIVFTCNHCPFVMGSQDWVDQLYAQYAAKGVRMIAINSNETIHHPNDSFEHMVERAKKLPTEVPRACAMNRRTLPARTPAPAALRTFMFLMPVASCDTPAEWMIARAIPPRPSRTSLRHVLDDLLAVRPCRVPLTNPIGATLNGLARKHIGCPPRLAIGVTASI